MNLPSFTFYAGLPRESLIARLISFLKTLPLGDAWKIEIKPYRKQRSLEQNAYLWGVVYQTILDEGGETLAGWDSADLHEYFLGEKFGWEVLEGFGRKRMRPVRRSSKLSTMEFMEYIDFIQCKMAQQGIVIPDPNQHLEAA